MRLIRPGKFGPSAESEKSTSTKDAKASRSIWDDYGEKKTKRKREYEKSDSNRTTILRPVRTALNFGGPADREKPVVDETPYEAAPIPDYAPLEERLFYTFKDHQLLTRALTHRSALGLKERSDYERLEFLGDAVLDLSIAHLLCEKYPDAKEGELSKMRAALVNTQALANVAKELEFGPFIRLGRGEVSSGGQERPSILADVTEAIIGAIYQDSSYEQAFRSIQLIFGSSLEQVQPSDPKTELQEALHAAGSEPPMYLLELVEGPEHAPTFVTVVVVDGEIAGRGRGATKKGAQQAAAAEALLKMAWSHATLELDETQEFFIERAMLFNPIVQTAVAAA